MVCVMWIKPVVSHCRLEPDKNEKVRSYFLLPAVSLAGGTPTSVWLMSTKNATQWSSFLCLCSVLFLLYSTLYMYCTALLPTTQNSLPRQDMGISFTILLSKVQARLLALTHQPTKTKEQPQQNHNNKLKPTKCRATVKLRQPTRQPETRTKKLSCLM